MIESDRDCLAADARLAVNKRLVILIFTTILVMWYLLAMLGYVLEVLKTGLNVFPLSGSILATVLLLPAILNSLAWLFFLIFSALQDALRRKYGGFSLEYRFLLSYRLIDTLAICQIIYIWLSFGYVILRVAEATVPGPIGSG